jgi:hypothetical protein
MSAAPAKDKKTVIVYSVFGGLLLIFVIYAYSAFFGGSTNPAATQAPASEAVAPKPNAVQHQAERSSNAAGNAKSGLGIAPGIAATKMASTSSSLDPTLDESAMLRTESLVYSGTGRNIFSSISAPPPIVIPKNVPSARPGAVNTGPPPPPPGPPPPPPITLKFFGTALRANGVRQAFLLDGEAVYLAAAGDIVSRRYKIVSINTTNIQVEDLVYNDTQSLPLQTH